MKQITITDLEVYSDNSNSITLRLKNNDNEISYRVDTGLTSLMCGSTSTSNLSKRDKVIAETCQAINFAFAECISTFGEDNEC